MELLKETYTFRNKEGKEITANKYYVIIHGVEVVLIPKEKSDIRFLNSVKVGEN